MTQSGSSFSPFPSFPLCPWHINRWTRLWGLAPTNMTSRRHCLIQHKNEENFLPCVLASLAWVAVLPFYKENAFWFILLCLGVLLWDIENIYFLTYPLTSLFWELKAHKPLGQGINSWSVLNYLIHPFNSHLFILLFPVPSTKDSARLFFIVLFSTGSELRNSQMMLCKSSDTELY